MSSQQTAIPRFFINIPEWLHNIKKTTINPTLMTLPVLPDPSGAPNVNVSGLMNGGQNFIAMLNCSSESSLGIYETTLTNIINIDGQYDGFRIAEFEDSVDMLYIDGTAGSIIIGTYHDMVNAPNLSLTMSREYSKIKEFTTYNGSSVSNRSWDRPDKWGKLAPWELFEPIEIDIPVLMGDITQDGVINVLDVVQIVNAIIGITGTHWTDLPEEIVEIIDINNDGFINVLDLVQVVNVILDLEPELQSNLIVGPENHKLSRSSRKTWELKFSYLDSSNLFGSNQMLNQAMFTQTGYESQDILEGSAYAPTLYEGVNPTTGTLVTGDPYSWSDNRGIYATETISPSDIYGAYPELEGKLTGILGANFSAFYFVPTGIWLGDTPILEGAYYQITIQSGTEPFTSELFNSISPDGFQHNISTDNNFFSQVWHKTLGGTIPFVFQPDNSNNNPDQFCIAKISSNSLKATQTAYNIYDISLKIEEVW